MSVLKFQRARVTRGASAGLAGIASASGIGTVVLLLAAGASLPAAAQGTSDSEITLTLTSRAHPADAALVYSLRSASAPMNITVNTIGGSGSRTLRVTHEGTLHISQSETPNLALDAISCTGAVASVDLAERAVALAITSDDAVTCTFSNNAVNRTAALTEQTLERTAKSLTTSLPATSNRVSERLSQSMGVRKIAIPQPAQDENGEPKPTGMIPLTGTATDDAGNAKFSTKLSDIAEANAREQAERVRDSGINLPGITVARPRFDGWAEGSIGYTSNDEDNTSDAFTNLAVGADYRLNEDWLVGMMGNYSTLESQTFETDPNISGRGWMAGPYAGYKINRQMFLSVKALHGAGETQFFGTPESPLMADGLETQRWLLDATLSGAWKTGRWTVSPTAQVTHFAERGHQISAGEETVGAKADSDRFLIGPEISYEFAPNDQTKIVPRAAVKGLWETEEIAVDDQSMTHDSLSTRLEAGIAVTSPKGRLDFSASLEGNEEQRAAAGKASVSVPLN